MDYEFIGLSIKTIEEKIKEYTIAYEAVDDPNVKRLIDSRITQFEVELGLYKRLLNKGEC